MIYQEEEIRHLAEQIHAEGLRVFLSKSGTHGFYTDAAGLRVVYFEWELSSICFSGCYHTSNPKSTGTGWGICSSTIPENFSQLLEARPPKWAVGDSSWRLTTLKQFLKTYQKSSVFKLLYKGL